MGQRNLDWSGRFLRGSSMSLTHRQTERDGQTTERAARVTIDRIVLNYSSTADHQTLAAYAITVHSNPARACTAGAQKCPFPFGNLGRGSVK